MTKLIVAFRNFSKAPKNGGNTDKCSCASVHSVTALCTVSLHCSTCQETHAGLTELCGLSKESFSAIDETPTNGLVADTGLETDGGKCYPRKVIILLRKKRRKGMQ